MFQNHADSALGPQSDGGRPPVVDNVQNTLLHLRENLRTAVQLRILVGVLSHLHFQRYADNIPRGAF